VKSQEVTQTTGRDAKKFPELSRSIDKIHLAKGDHDFLTIAEFAGNAAITLRVQLGAKMKCAYQDIENVPSRSIPGNFKRLSSFYSAATLAEVIGLANADSN